MMWAKLMAWLFCKWTGRAIQRVEGYLMLRRYLPTETAHRASLRLIRWTYWQPAWAAQAKQMKEDQHGR